MEKAGSDLRDTSAEKRSEAARAMGQARTPAKIRAAQEQAEARRGVPLSEEHREKIRIAQAAHWERRRAEKAAAAALLPPPEKKRPGRPRKETDPNAPKRGRGRPKKQDAQTTGAEG